MTRLDPERIPEVLRYLIPLAEKWGISDDSYRDDVVLSSSSADLIELIEVMSNANQNEFDKWLAGTNMKAILNTPEYTAFSCLRQAYYSAEIEYDLRLKEQS